LCPGRGRKASLRVVFASRADALKQWPSPISPPPLQMPIGRLRRMICNSAIFTIITPKLIEQSIDYLILAMQSFRSPMQSVGGT
jgi:hypothetical protein